MPNAEILENLHRTTNEFEKTLTDAKKLAACLKKSTTQMLDGMKSLNRLLSPIANTCTICFESERKYVARPCGHCVCEQCKTRCESSLPIRCFICRALVRQLFRIYL